MLPLAAGLALTAAGAAANYFGGKSEAARRQGAIDQFNARTQAINQALLENLTKQGQMEQAGITKSITDSGAPAMGRAAGVEDQRQSDAAARLAALSKDLPPGATGVPDAQGAAYTRAMGRRAMALRALNLSRLLAQQDTQRGIGARDASLPVAVNAPASATAQTRAGIDRTNAQAELDSVLGTTGNTAMNMQLLGGLANAGGSATMMLGALR